MLRFIISQIRHRPGRAGALGVGIVVAAVSFVLLTAASSSGELRVRGTVKSTFRPAYDILVRPRGSTTQIERAQGLVRDNYLSGIFGGISIEQYDAIKRLAGVQVAAPIANVGYVMPTGDIPISIQNAVDNAPVQLYRVKLSWVADDGTSRYPAGESYVYVNRSHRFTSTRQGTSAGPPQEIVPGQPTPLDVCQGLAATQPLATGPFSASALRRILCFSTKTPSVNENNFAGAVRPHGAGIVYQGAFPILLSAIDPTEEDKLLDLGRTVVKGRYLSEQDRLFTRMENGAGHRFLPVLISSHNFVDETLQVDVERLKVKNPAQVPQLLAAGTCELSLVPCPTGESEAPPAGWPRDETAYGFLSSLSGTVVASRQIPASAGYRSVLREGATLGGLSNNSAASYWTTSATHYAQLQNGTLVPRATQNSASVFSNPLFALGGGYLPAPPDNQDTQFRRLQVHAGSNAFLAGNVYATPQFDIVGTYDPSKLPGFSPLSKVPLETYYPPTLTPATRATAAVLKGQPLGPSQNLGNYIQQPPLMLTTINALSAFSNPKFFAGSPPLNAKAPISVIRVRVADVTGTDTRSRARIESVALRIHDETGLDVDITAGSSPHPMTVRLPAGRFGRPQLTLSEGWSKKGVSIAFLHGVGRKQLALFCLIPLLCCLFLANGVYAVARARRVEIGTLLTLGWSSGAIFRVLLGEIVLIGIAAGAAGVATAVVLVAALSLHASLLATLLVLPTAVALAAVAGALPAWRAARGEPLAAIRPAVSRSTRTIRVRSLTALAFVNLRRVPVRALIGAVGLGVGAAGLTVLVAVEQAFQGVLAGTVLGDAISVQIRGFDYLAIGLVIGLAALSIADVLYLNLRERQAELVTLRTVGWETRHLARVVGIEAAVLGLVGAGAGAILGMAVAFAVLAAPIGAVLIGAAVAVAGGVAASLVASLLPLSQIGKLTPPSVLAAEQ